jgi:hypothetical protein
MHIQSIRLPRDDIQVALILGTGDIASAIARELFLMDWGVVMLRDEAVPVLRRGMAFDDALEDGVAELDGVWGARAASSEMVPALAQGREAVVVARLDTAVAIGICRGTVNILIDARMRKYAPSADLRPLAGCAIGVGPGFVAGETVDVAIETLPNQEGGVVMRGPTATPTGQSVPLGGAKEERFACATTAGSWEPMVALGTWADAGAILGNLAGRKILAPISGRVRGIVRPMPNGIARGAKLVEIDPRPNAPHSGVPPRASRIASGARRAIGALLPVRPVVAAE